MFSNNDYGKFNNSYGKYVKKDAEFWAKVNNGTINVPDNEAAKLRCQFRKTQGKEEKKNLIPKIIKAEKKALSPTPSVENFSKEIDRLKQEETKSKKQQNPSSLNDYLKVNKFAGYDSYLLKQFLLSDKKVNGGEVPKELDKKIDELQGQEIFLLDDSAPTKIGGGKYHTVYKANVMQENKEKEIIWKSIATNTKVDAGRTSSAYMSGINKIESKAVLAERSVLTKTLDRYLFPNNSVCAETKAANMLPGSFGGNANASSSGIIMDMAKGEAIALREVTFDLSKDSADDNNKKSFNKLSGYISNLGNIDEFLSQAKKPMKEFRKKYPQLQVSKFFSRLKIIDTKMEFNDTNVLKKALEGTIRLGILDYISGQVDRHYENYYVASDGTITAIDNDLSFGSKAGARGQKSFLVPNKGSLLVNLPKVITGEIKSELEEFFFSLDENNGNKSKAESFLDEVKSVFPEGSKEYSSLEKRINDVGELLFRAKINDDLLSEEAIKKMDSESNYLIRDLLVRQSDAKGIFNKFGWNQFRANRKALKLDSSQIKIANGNKIKKSDRSNKTKAPKTYNVDKIISYMPVGTTKEFAQFMIDHKLIGDNLRISTKRFSELSKEYRHKYDMYSSARNGIIKYQINNKKSAKIIKDKKNKKQWWIAAPEELHMFRGLQGFITVDYLLGDPVGTFNIETKDAIIGRIISDKSATSTSITERVSEYYAKKNNNSREVVMLKLTCPEGVKIGPIGNQWDEIVMKPGQQQVITKVTSTKNNGFDWVTIEAKLLPDNDKTAGSVSGENEDTEIDFKSTEVASNMIRYEDKIYKTPFFQSVQEDFEIELGKYAYNSDVSYGALHNIIHAMKQKIESEENKKKVRREIHNIYREQFFGAGYYKKVNKKDFSGAVGSKLSDEEIDALLKEEKPENKIVEDIATELTAPGNLREKLLAIQSFFVDRKEEKNWAGKSFNDYIEPHIGRARYKRFDMEVGKEGSDGYEDRLREFKAKYDRELDYQDQMGLYRSAREKRYQEHKYQKSGNDDGKSLINYGQKLWQPLYNGEELKSVGPKRIPTGKTYNIKLNSFGGKRLVAGTSGTTERLINSLKAQNFSGISDNNEALVNFRFAIMGCMLPEKNHSLYEILQGSHEVGVKGHENLGTAYSMDRSVAPLSEGEIRNKIGNKLKDKYNIKSKQEGVLPLEISYVEYFKNKMKEQNHSRNA